MIPQAEVWGFSTTLSKLGETMLVALESKHPRACILPDVYHLYKGGSEFAGLRLLAGSAIHCFHMNDYPATPARDTIKDADRVYPGDGIAPLSQILRDLFATGFAGVLSLELFNPGYWQQDAADRRPHRPGEDENFGRQGGGSVERNSFRSCGSERNKFRSLPSLRERAGSEGLRCDWTTAAQTTGTE